MPHYYAYCQSHGKCGDNRETPEQAAEDCNDHVATVAGPHGLVYPKLSNMKIINGIRKYSYKHIKKLGIVAEQR